jgi:hypothetical protein
MFYFSAGRRYDRAMPHPNVIALQNEISHEFPDFRLRKKGESTLMRLIGFVLMVMTFGKNRDFMTRFTTTLGNTIFVPDDWEKRLPMSQCITLRHERVHMRQSKKYGRLMFSFLYLFWPLPVFRATWRRRFEQEAYEESIRAMHEYGEDPANYVYRVRMILHFTSSEYFWMWTKESDIEEWFDSTVSRIVGEKKN